MEFAYRDDDSAFAKPAYMALLSQFTAEPTEIAEKEK